MLPAIAALECQRCGQRLRSEPHVLPSPCRGGHERSRLTMPAAPSAPPATSGCRRCRCARLITRVPGLRPVRTSETSTPAASSRARVASMSATRQLRPHSLSWVWSPPATGRLHDLDDEIAAAEEHQLAPILMRAVERHVEPEPRAIERGGALRILGRDHDMIERRDRPTADVATERGRSLASSRKNIRTPRVSSVAARVRFHDRVAPETESRLSTSATGSGFSATPVEPAMHLGDVAGAKADAGEPLAPDLDHVADAIGGHANAVRRHQLQRHVVEREQHAVGAVAAVSPRRRRPNSVS